MAKIFKYAIEPEGTIVGAGMVTRLLTTAWQGDDLCVWAEVEDWLYGEIIEGQAPAGYHVVPIPTGENTPPGYTYLGTAHPDSSSPKFFGAGIVMHVYYIRIHRT